MNSVHVEPIWFSLDNLTVCAVALTTAQWYCTQLKKISDALKQNGYTMNWFYIVYAYRIVLFENMYFFYTLIARS